MILRVYMVNGQAGQVLLEALLPHVGPSAEETQAAYAEAVKQLEASVKTLGFVNLNEDSSKNKVQLAHLLSQVS